MVLVVFQVFYAVFVFLLSIFNIAFFLIYISQVHLVVLVIRKFFLLAFYSFFGFIKLPQVEIAGEQVIVIVKRLGIIIQQGFVQHRGLIVFPVGEILGGQLLIRIFL